MTESQIEARLAFEQRQQQEQQHKQTPVEESWYRKKAREQGIDLDNAPIKINDKSFANVVTSETAEYNQAPAGSPLSGATTLDGRALSVLEAQRMNPAEVLVYHDGVPLRLQMAERLGIVAILDGGVVVDRTKAASGTSGQPAGQPQGQAAGQQDNQGSTEAEQEAAFKEAARAPLFDEQAANDLAAATEAMTRSGLDPAREIDSMISTGLVNPVALDAIAEGLDVEPEVALQWLSDAGRHITGTMQDALISQGHEEADALALMVEAAEANPQAWIAAATASVHAGSIIPLMRALASHVEHRMAHGG